MQALLGRGQKLVDDAETAVTRVNAALKNADTALNSAIGLQKDLAQMQAEQSEAIARRLANDNTFVSSVSSVTSNAIVRLSSDVEQTRQSITAMKGSTGFLAIKGTDRSVANHEGPVEGLSGTENIHQDFVACPAGSFVSALQGFTNSSGLFRQIRYACRGI